MLERAHPIAQLFFSRLETPAENAYVGAFSDEFDYTGVAGYAHVYGAETRKTGNETERLENVEQRVYGNVAAIMGVFIALFTMMIVDIAWMPTKMGDVVSLVTLNLSLVGGMAAMVGLISAVLGARGERRLPSVVSVAAFMAAFALTLLFR